MEKEYNFYKSSRFFCRSIQMPSSLVNPTCFVCGTSNNKKLFVSNNVHGRVVINADDHFHVYKCNTCDSVYLGNVIVSKEYYQKYYDKDYYNASILTSANFVQKTCLVLEKFSFSRKVNLFKNFFKEKKKYNILDIGCGTGKFLLRLDSNVFTKYGIEINAEGYKQCIQNGIIAYNQALQDIDFGTTKFDVITLFHVLEHLENPTQTLLAIHPILSDDGVLIISVPNNRSLGFLLGYKNWFHLDSPRHLFIPSIHTLKYLADKTNFKILKSFNAFYEYPMDLFWSIKYSKYKYFIYLLYPFFKMFSKESITILLKKQKC